MIENETPPGARDKNIEDTPTGTPRWVKAFAIIALVIVVAVVVLLLVGGNHGPSRHMS